MNRPVSKEQTFTDTQDHTPRIDGWTDRFVTTEGIAVKVLLEKVLSITIICTRNFSSMKQAT